MQDTQAIAGGGGGRLFDRRSQQQHALKCPRCDSVNTKFCYYNNYNLSQPRYFCKGCRRYWTKGGVLRNVPVGGGCRKTKRSSKPKNTTTTAPPSSNSHSHSSSESSSLAAAATTATAAGSSGEAASASRYFLDPPSEGQIFTEMGTFTSLMTSSSNDPAVPDISGAGGGELKMEEQISCGGFLDQATHVGLDWQISDGGGDEQGLFDFTGAVDQTYWGQNQWSDHDHDHSLNFPPLV